MKLFETADTQKLSEERAGISDHRHYGFYETRV